MNKLTDLIKTFKKVDNWQQFVENNFERKSGTYSYVSVTEIDIKYDKQLFRYPTKVVFEDGYVKAQKDITKRETLIINNKPVRIIERKKIIPLGFYKRDKKFSGDIYQIIADILGEKKIQNSVFSDDLLTPNDNPFFSIDSKQKWTSYLLILQQESKQKENITNLEDFSFLNDILNDYGIHYGFENLLQDYVIVVFPMPYLRIVENKIQKKDDNESIFLVVEFNQLPIFYTSQSKIEIDGLIKNLQGEIIYKETETIKFGKAKYQVVEITPKQKSEIGYTEFAIKINKVTVDKFSGYYIRDIKVNIKAK